MSSRFPGIRELYPNVTILSRKTRGFVAASRPITCVAVLVGLLAGLSMAVGYHYTTWATIWASRLDVLDGFVALLLAQVGSNLTNQSTDLEDDVTKPWRPIQRGVLTRDEAASLGHLAWFIAIFRAATISAIFGLLVGGIVLLSYAYSTPPIRLKKRTWFGNGAIALARGLLGLPAAWALVAPWNAAPIWLAGGILAFFTFGAVTAKDMADEDGDARYGVRTLVVAYGAFQAGLIASLFVLATIPLLIISRLRISYPVEAVADVSLLILVGKLFFMDVRANRIAEGSRVWFWYYASTMMIMLAFASAVVA